MGWFSEKQTQEQSPEPTIESRCCVSNWRWERCKGSLGEILLLVDLNENYQSIAEIKFNTAYGYYEYSIHGRGLNVLYEKASTERRAQYIVEELLHKKKAEDRAEARREQREKERLEQEYKDMTEIKYLFFKVKPNEPPAM